MEQVKLGAAKDILPGSMKEITIKGSELLVVNLGGQYYCMTGLCTHMQGHLAQGRLNGDVVTCPRHGSRFKVTDGSVVEGPARKPLITYKIAVNDGQLVADL